METPIPLPELIRDQATIVRLMVNDFYLSLMIKTRTNSGMEITYLNHIDLHLIILELLGFNSFPNYEDIKEKYLTKLEEYGASYLDFPSLNVDDMMLNLYLELRGLL